MESFSGTVRNGQIVLDRPADLSDGMRVEVLPIDDRQLTLGMREEDWPSSSEGIAALLARMDAIEPAWLSPEDEAAWRKVLAEQKERDKRQFSANAEHLRSMWE